MNLYTYIHVYIHVFVVKREPIGIPHKARLEHNVNVVLFISCLGDEARECVIEANRNPNATKGRVHKGDVRFACCNLGLVCYMYVQ